MLPGTESHLHGVGCSGWLGVFRADTLADAKVILHQMFTWENGIYPASLFVNRKVIFLAVLGVLLSGIVQSVCLSCGSIYMRKK